MLRRLYDWVLSWAQRPGGVIALFFFSLCEASFFPIPPDVLLIALAVGAPKKSFWFAAVCSVGSVIGACIGYMIGWQFMDLVGNGIITFYGLESKVEYIAALYQKWDAWAVSMAGFTPLPYKLFTISAGAFGVSFPIFVVASVFSRTLRFALVGGLIYLFGPSIQKFIDRYFNILAIIFFILLIGGFFLIKYLL
ncbi:MAG: DedA family protein [Desulfobacteraceae bacterium]|nr:DedA family protein [Desulfobacteraceae bacterium]